MSRAKTKKWGNFQWFGTYNWFVPGVSQIFVLLLWLIAGGIVGNFVTFFFLSSLDAKYFDYSILISYPILFIPAMVYAGVRSKLASYNKEGVKIDSKNFGKTGGALCAVLVVLATLALAYCCDLLVAMMPEMPQKMKELIENMTQGVFWVNFLSVSIFAPLFEEWLCRGMILRGLLYNKMKPFWAIVLSSFLFALIHLNPWQAVPAFAIGCLFGYVYYKTGSLKLVMLMHFSNNTFSLLLSNIESMKDATTWMDVLPREQYFTLFAGCILLLILIIRVFKRIPKLSKEGNCDKVSPIFEG